MQLPAGEAHSFRIRVGYVDTDQGGIVHHSNYLRYLEVARIEFMRARGMDYRVLESEQHLGLAVVEANVRYRRPARFDDSIELRTWLVSANRAKLRFDSLILRGDEVLIEGQITLCCLRLPEARICSVPPAIIALAPARK